MKQRVKLEIRQRKSTCKKELQSNLRSDWAPFIKHFQFQVRDLCGGAGGSAGLNQPLKWEGGELGPSGDFRTVLTESVTSCRMAVWDEWLCWPSHAKVVGLRWRLDRCQSTLVLTFLLCLQLYDNLTNQNPTKWFISKFPVMSSLLCFYHCFFQSTKHIVSIK